MHFPFDLLMVLAVKGSGHICKLNLCGWNVTNILMNILNLLESHTLIHVASSILYLGCGAFINNGSDRRNLCGSSSKAVSWEWKSLKG